MNSHRKSDGKIFRFTGFGRCSLLKVGVFITLSLVVGACQSSHRTRVLDAENPVRLADQLNEEVSLKADREQFEQLRKDVPQQKQIANDELAFDMDLLAQADRPPNEIRSRYQEKVRKLRNRFRSKSQKVRTQFRDVQKKQRDQFLQNLKDQREEFKAQKVEREKTKEFYDHQDLERKEFFAEQKDQRKEFESDMRQKSKDFHANMRERTKQFNEQMRIYSQRYNEKKRQQQKDKQQNKSSQTSFRPNKKLDKKTEQILQEFDDMKSMPKGEKLGP